MTPSEREEAVALAINNMDWSQLDRGIAPSNEEIARAAIAALDIDRIEREHPHQISVEYACGGQEFWDLEPDGSLRIDIPRDRVAVSESDLAEHDIDAMLDAVHPEARLTVAWVPESPQYYAEVIYPFGDRWEPQQRARRISTASADRVAQAIADACRQAIEALEAFRSHYGANQCR